MIRQIAEMWKLEKPGRLAQTEGHVTFQLCFPVKIQITAFQRVPVLFLSPVNFTSLE
jgi:hypothetical protein